MTRVLTLSLYYPPHHVGGYEVSCRDVMDRLAQRGHDVTVLTTTARLPGVDDPAGEARAAVPVRRELQAWFRDDHLYAPSLPVRWTTERRNHAALQHALDDAHPEVVSVWQLGAVSLGLLTAVAERGIPVVYAVSDDWLSYGPVLDAWSRLFTRRPGVGRALRPLLGVPTTLGDLGATGTFCFISEVTRERAERYAPGSQRPGPRFPDATVVYSGIDLHLFTLADGPVVERPWRGRLLYVGRYDTRKGIETLIRAMPLLDAATTLEVQGTGDPGERARLEALAAELGVAARVTFGAVTRAELPERYRAADAVVFPSEWEEPFGLVPVEAMACDTPVAATGVGGSGEFCIDGENCVLFTAGDPADLAAAVRRLARDADLRRHLVTQGRTTARYFSVDHLTDAFEAWHAAAATRFAAGRPPRRTFTLAPLDAST